MKEIDLDVLDTGMYMYFGHEKTPMQKNKEKNQ